jgi:hypothetical protein
LSPGMRLPLGKHGGLCQVMELASVKKAFQDVLLNIKIIVANGREPVTELGEVFGSLPPPDELQDSTCLKGKCPIHREQSGEAFAVYPKKNKWICYGKCQARGNVIDLAWLLFFKSMKHARIHAVCHLVKVIKQLYNKEPPEALLTAEVKLILSGSTYEIPFSFFANDLEHVKKSKSDRRRSVSKEKQKQNLERQQEVLLELKDYNRHELVAESPFDVEGSDWHTVGNEVVPQFWEDTDIVCAGYGFYPPYVTGTIEPCKWVPTSRRKNFLRFCRAFLKACASDHTHMHLPPRMQDLVPTPHGNAI